MASITKPRNKNKNKRKTKIMAALAVLALLVVIIVLLLLRGCSPEAPATGGLVYDSNAVEGGWDEADTDAIIAGLNEKVEEGMINISMNTSPVFADGASEGNLMIVNEDINNYPQIVEITLNNTGEVIYRSDGIPVGSKIETAALLVDLPAGAYECTAMFHSVDPDTGVSLGQAGAIITITILN